MVGKTVLPVFILAFVIVWNFQLFYKHSLRSKNDTRTLSIWLSAPMKNSAPCGNGTNVCHSFTDICVGFICSFVRSFIRLFRIVYGFPFQHNFPSARTHCSLCVAWKTIQFFFTAIQFVVDFHSVNNFRACLDWIHNIQTPKPIVSAIRRKCFRRLLFFPSLFFRSIQKMCNVFYFNQKEFMWISR